jgi:hypothetical protein
MWSTNQVWPQIDYESHMSSPSLPLDGGSLGDRTIPVRVRCVHWILTFAMGLFHLHLLPFYFTGPFHLLQVYFTSPCAGN